MAWCPVCKLEYVDGVTICPDCKSVLVESLEEAENTEISDENATINFGGYEAEDFFGEDAKTAEIEAQMAQMELVARMQKVMENPPYKSKAEKYNDNKSGSSVLLIFGLVGIVVLVLNALGIITLPMYGYSLTMLNIVMGTLFFIFIMSGITSIIRIKTLKPEVEKEKADIEAIINFLKTKKANGDYAIDKNAYEESYLLVSEKAVSDIEAEFPDMVKGFAFYVVDRYGSEILDED